jgi:glutamine synthetase
MFRLPQTRKAIENRAADMCQNVYLSLAMTAAASLEGIEESITPDAEVTQSLYDMSVEERANANIKRLPTNLLEAIQMFDEDPLARETMGATMHGMYSRLKRAEWARFHEHVTEWERVEYLRFF